MKQILLFVALTLYSVFSFSQGKRANNWYFGFFAGLSFNAGSPPEVLYDGQTDFSYDGAAAISDEEGNLLFYSNGAKLWNKEHQRMQNSLGIGDYSPQGAMIVPDPGNPDIYYIFNFRADGPSITHFQYSVIDMRLDSGMGGVIPEKKTILLLQNTTFHLSAVQHTNGEDVWVVVHKVDNIDYYSYKITRNGIENPVISNAGTLFQSRFGYLKFSPNGKKIGAALYAWNNTCEILDFNAETGEITDDNLISTSKGALGIEFSSDNSKVYTNSGGINSLYQYDLNAGSPADILASEVLLTTEVLSDGALQLGPDGKIYCATDAQYVGVIHEPNKIGLECNYERYSIYVGDGRLVGEGLPSFIQSYLNDPEYATVQNCAGQPTQFTIANTNGIDSVYWKFKDFSNMPNDTSTLLSPAYTFSGPGTYYPELTVYSGLLQKTVKDTVIIYALPLPQLGSDTLFCPGTPIALMLDAGPGEFYNWNGNFTPGGQTLAVTDTGTYFVRVKEHGCSGFDTIHVGNYPQATADISNAEFKNANCNQSDGAVTGLLFNAPPPFTIVWTNASGTAVGNTPDLIDVPAGSYTATVSFGNNCSQEFGPYSISDNNATQISEVQPTDDHCNQGQGRLIVLPESGAVGDFLYSLDGINYQANGGVFSGLGEGEYHISLKDAAGCISNDFTGLIENIPGPEITGPIIITPETGSDANGTITLTATGDNLSYSINGGPAQDNGFFNGLSTGDYTITISDLYNCTTDTLIHVDPITGSYLVALADNDRKCLHKPANSEIRIASVSGMKDLKATLYYNSGILNCTNFNADSTDFPAITAQLYSLPPRIEIEWHGTSPLTSSDTLSLGTLIFETIQTGLADINWEPGSPLTYFLNEYGDTIQPVLIPGSIRVHEIPQISLQQPIPLCEGGSATLIAGINGGTDPVEYNWETPNGINHNQSPELFIEHATTTDSGLYRFTVSDYFYCSDTSQITLTVIPLPRANFPATNDTIYYEQTYLLEAQSDYASYQWSTGDTTYYINITEDGEYSVILQTAEGCTNLEKVTLVDTWFPFNIPNAFTPNGDGLNDTFRPVTDYDRFSKYSMVIYNSWGQRIFETTNPATGWDGKDAPAGVYSWVISYSDYTGKVFKMKGIVTLVK